MQEVVLDRIEIPLGEIARTSRAEDRRLPEIELPGAAVPGWWVKGPSGLCA